MLILNEKDILQAVTMNDVILAIEEAYVLYESNDFQMPLRNQMTDQDNTMLLMPCVAKDSTALKIVHVFPNNHEYPVTQGVMMLNDRENGTIKGILNGTVLTGIRTGAIGGVAIKYLAPENASSVGLIGTGFQGLHQLIAACTVRNIKDIYLYNRTASKLPSFVQALKNKIAKEIEIHIVSSTSELVDLADIIVTATTSNSPVLPTIQNAFNGKLIIGIGSYQPQMREFSETIYKNVDFLYVDTLDAIQESGDVIDPIQHNWLVESQVISLSKVITQKIHPTFSEHRPTVFKSTGMALFDLVVANVIYEKALNKQIGQYVNL
ncbi:ornithine cyclodeaminase family protein [Rummeliibacillus pycnus]|uniref:ornithine cyclodeaminase family protein n=1 Tax=Rummeliibacillus pycnus TaxID=101070 RepID=UPI003D2B8549